MSLEAANHEHGGLFWQAWLLQIGSRQGGSLPLGLPSSQPLLHGHNGQPPVLSPQAAVAQPRRRQQVGIRIANPSTHQPVALNQQQHFRIAGHPGVDQRLALLQERGETGQTMAQMLHPHGRIDQDHAAL